MPDSHSRVDAAIKAFAKGEIVVVTDDDDRENEGDLFVAASLCTPEKMAFIIRNTSGIVCAPLGAEQARRLHLDPMVAENDAPLGTAFTVTVDVRHGLTTGISAEERCNTVRALANNNCGAADFVRPGHVFPLVAREGGVLMRSGHTEACVDLCRLASLPPVGVLSELTNDDGTVMRGPQVAAFAAEAQVRAGLDRRAHRLPAEPRQAGGAGRRIPAGVRHRHAQRLRLCDAVRPRAPHGLRLRRSRRRQKCAGAAAPRRRDRRRVRRRQADPRRARALQGGRPRRHRLPARRHRRRAGRRNPARRRAPAPTPRARGNGARSGSARRSSRTSALPRSACSPPASALTWVSAASASRSWPPSRSRDSADAAFFLPPPRASFRTWGDVEFTIALAGLSGGASRAVAALAAPLPRFADNSPSAIPVDVELVIAVDVSYSMDPDEQALQREGYVQALTSKRIPAGAARRRQRQDRHHLFRMGRAVRPEDPDAVATDRGAGIGRRRRRRTCRRALPARLAHLDFRRAHLCQAAVRQQRLPRPAPRHRRVRRRRQQCRRRRSCRRATTCSPPASPSTGCRSCSSAPTPGTMDIENLDVYYEDCVIGGPGSFVIPIRERAQFIEATRQKLVQEVAGPRAAARA